MKKSAGPMLVLSLVVSVVSAQGAPDKARRAVSPATPEAAGVSAADVRHATAAVTLSGEKIAPLALPYENNCDEPDPAWEPFLNYWRLKPEQWYWDASGGNPGGCLRHEVSLGVRDPKRGAHDAAVLLRGGEDWPDYVFEADAYAGRGHFGLWFRADMRDEGDGNGRWVKGYYFVVIPRGSKFRLWRARQDGLVVETGSGEPSKPEKNHFSNPVLLAEGTIPESVTYGSWHKLRVEARGNRLAVSVEGRELAAVEDDLYKTGSVGFTTYKGEDVRFDNVRVTPLGAAPIARKPLRN